MISNFELEEAAKIMGIKNFKCMSKDELPNPLPYGKYIINMQNSVSPSGRQLPGTHWFSCEVTSLGTWVVDAFGAPPPEEILDRAKYPIHYNTRQIEDLNSDLCGFYSLYVLFQHQQGRAYESIVNDFYTYPKTKLNRYILDEYFQIRSK